MLAVRATPAASHVCTIEGKTFTLAHRPAIPERPSRALIFTCDVPDELVGSVDWNRVIVSESKELTIDDLYNRAPVGGLTGKEPSVSRNG